MSIPLQFVRHAIVAMCLGGLAYAQPAPLTLSKDAQTLSELLHAIVPELRDSSAQLQLSQSGSEWRFRIESSRIGDRGPARAEGIARLTNGRLTRLRMSHADRAGRISSTAIVPLPVDAPASPRAADLASTAAPASAAVTAQTAPSGPDRLAPGAADSAPASSGPVRSTSEPVRSATQGHRGLPPSVTGLTAQDALDFATPALQKALGAFEPNAAAFSNGSTAAVEWRFDVQTTADGTPTRYRLEFDPASGRIISIEVR